MEEDHPLHGFYKVTFPRLIFSPFASASSLRLVEINPFGLAWWYWLGTWECAPPKGLMFNYPRCQFKWAYLASSKKNTCGNPSSAILWSYYETIDQLIKCVKLLIICILSLYFYVIFVHLKLCHFNNICHYCFENVVETRFWVV